LAKKNTDLIPYAIEHEIYEAWLWSKRGYIAQNSETNHLLARRKQFEAAMKDGKAEKLLDFYKKINPEITSELEYAYRKTRSKKMGSMP
jgi:hypothetical protein